MGIYKRGQAGSKKCPLFGMPAGFKSPYNPL